MEAEEYIQLIKTPCEDPEVRDAFIFCCYTGLRWCDVQAFSPSHIKTAHCIVQKKTQVEHHIALHPVAKAILDKRLARQDSSQLRPLFTPPTSEEARHILAAWCKNAGIDKHITWSCARLSFSILLQDAQVDCATVSLLLGHKTTRHVFETYKRYRPKDQEATIALLPHLTPVQSIQSIKNPTIFTRSISFQSNEALLQSLFVPPNHIEKQQYRKQHLLARLLTSVITALTSLNQSFRNKTGLWVSIVCLLSPFTCQQWTFILHPGVFAMGKGSIIP